MAPPQSQIADVFISHAREDKRAIAQPLAEALRAKGLTVWYDQFVLRLGDSLRQVIDLGLSTSRFGVVILSPAFFSKQWPQRELDGLLARETADKAKILLPIWHNLTFEEVRQFSPTLADRLAATTDQGLEAIVQQILEAMGWNGPPARLDAALDPATLAHETELHAQDPIPADGERPPHEQEPIGTAQEPTPLSLIGPPADPGAQSSLSFERFPTRRPRRGFPNNWWRLCWEPERRGIDWRMTHSLPAIGGGYVWPDVTIHSDGELVLVQARPTVDKEWEPVRHLEHYDCNVPVGEFEEAIESFVDSVLRRLAGCQIEGTELHLLWQELSRERLDPAVAPVRRLEALLV
jgi:hypothetical protein